MLYLYSKLHEPFERIERIVKEREIIATKTNFIELKFLFLANIFSNNSQTK